MTASKRALILISLLLLSLVLVGLVQAQAGGGLAGLVVNGTAGGPPIGSGIPVTLHILQDDSELSTVETTTGSDGSFAFESLDTDPNLEYWPEATYLDVAYSPVEPYRFDEGSTNLDATIIVFETTTDDSAIQLDSVHLIAESFGEAMRVSEIHLFGNTGDRTYIGGAEGDDATTVLIPLPESAVGFAFGDGTSEEAYVQVGDTVLSSDPVQPGEESMLAFFSYHLMVTGDTVPLERHFTYPVVALNLLAAQPGLTATSDQLQAMGSETFQGQQYQYYVGVGLEPGEPLAFELAPSSGMPGGQPAGGMPPEAGATTTGGSVRGNQRLLLQLGIVLSIVVVVGAVVYSVATRRAAPDAAASADLFSNPQGRRLVAALADLEDEYKAGELTESDYEVQRAKLYQEVKSLQS